jgi:uncharacterized ferredoxin-like protein
MYGVEMVAQLMAISATTAPKSKGENFVKTRVLEGKVLKELADAMLAYGQRTKKKDFDRDSKNVAESDAVLLIGLKKTSVLGLDCAACESRKKNPVNLSARPAPSVCWIWESH